MDQRKRVRQIHEDLSKNIVKIRSSIDENVQKAAENLTREKSLKAEKARLYVRFTNILLEKYVVLGKEKTRS